MKKKTTSSQSSQKNVVNTNDYTRSKDAYDGNMEITNLRVGNPLEAPMVIHSYPQESQLRCGENVEK